MHPRICPDFATKFLVYCTGIPGFGELLRHGATHKNFFGYAAGLYFDGYADIEAALNPGCLSQDGAGVFTGQSEVVYGKSLDDLCLLPKVLIQILG
jgi:hypothetical protein